MPHLLSYRTSPSATVSAAVRGRLGITQPELGDLLGVGRAQVGHVEAGRRGYSARAQARLTRLCELLPAHLFQPDGALAVPPAEPAFPTDAPPGPTPAEQTALRRRLRACRHQLAGLLYEAQGRPALAAALARRTQALAALHAALAAPPAADAHVESARETAWLELVELATARVARRQPTPTARAWTALRQRLLEAEIAGLTELLGE